jgi:hypothetical protein
LVKSDGSGKWVVLGYMPDNLKELVMILENGDPDEKERMGWNSLPGSILLLFLSVSSISSLTFSLMSFFMAIKGYLNEGKVSCAFSKLACHEAEFWVTYSIGWFLLFVLLFIVSFCLVQILKKKKRHSKFY